MNAAARDALGNPGRSGHRQALAAERIVRAARQEISKLLNAESPDTIVLALNGTDALNMAIKGLELARGDHVVTTELEHNSVNRPLGRLAAERGVGVTKARACAAGFVEPEEIQRCLVPGTKLIAATHCSNVTGAVAPLEEYSRIAREAGVRLLVDAAQTAGVVQMDVRKTPVDLLAFPGHKGLFGPMGTGALYVRPGLELGFFREGGTGTASEVELHPEAMPHRLEGGTPNVPGLAGLAAGVEFVRSRGTQAIRSHEHALAMLFLGLVAGDRKILVHSGKDPARQIGPVSVSVEAAEPEEIAAILDERFGISTRPGLHCAPGAHRALGTFPRGSLRFSFGAFNSEEDSRTAARALLEVAAAM